MKNTALLICMLAVPACMSCNNNAEEVSDKDSAIKQEPTAAVMAEVNDYAESVNKGLIADTMKGSPVRMATGNINGKHIQIEYGSPGVKGRTIWDSLVPYNKVWVTGSHHATSISFSNDAVFGDKKITAGKYALFTIPGKKSWTVILNKNYDQHQADEYKETEDVARITGQPEINDKIVQRLTYSIDQTGEQKGKIIIQWEKISINIPVSFN